jgi:hypothetical protein
MRQSRKTWMLPKDEPLMEATGGGLSTALWMLVGAALIFIALVLIVPSLPSGPPPTERPAITSGPIATPPRALPTPGSSGGGGMSGTLPDCATVTDSRTACTGAVGEMPQGGEVQEQEAQPTPTMELAPNAIECWQGAFYTCEELAEMGEERAIEAVQAADTFVDVQTLPTPAPAFVEYATDACARAEVKSILCP